MENVMLMILLKNYQKKDKAEITKWIEYLKEKGAFAQRPQTAILRGGDEGIYELRVQLKGKKKTRTLYFFCYENYIVLTHIFVKTTKKVPENEIAKAIKYKNDFLKRFNKNNIKGE